MQKFGIIFASFLLFVIGIFLYLNYIVNPVILQMSEAKVKSLATKAVGNAIYEIINQNNNIYSNLMKFVYDDEENIKAIQVDSIQINLLTRSLAKLAQSNLEQIGSNGIDIPIGSFSGMPILVGRGPTVNIKLVPIGSITSDFSSEFSEAGINQTNHKIYVTVVANVSVVLPTSNQTIQTSTQVLICENIIVGEIPTTYLSSNSLDEMLNLVP